MKVNYLTHVPYEGLGALECALIRAGHGLARTRLYAGEPLPDPEAVEGLVVMGGPMSIHDEQEHPWLVAEKRFVARVLERGVPVLGICLGAQLVAHALGARVRPNAEREIGWFPVERTAGAGPSALDGLPRRFTAFHWHGETFDLPQGAVHLASSAACRNQAFMHGRALALQFHLEVLPSGVADLCVHGADDLRPGRHVQTPEEMLGDPGRFHPIASWSGTVVEAVFGQPG
jgi:GMP synthase-like glutamine amidotransferase